MKLFDAALSIARKRRALGRGAAGVDFLVAHAAEDLGDRLSATRRRFKRAAALFSVTDHAARALVESGKVDEVIRVEADPTFLPPGEGILAPVETIPLEPESIDLAVSLLTLQEVNDLPGLLIQIRRALQADGLFIGCMAGGGTLAELRESLLAAESELDGGANTRVIPFAEVRDAGTLLQRAGFALPVTDTESLTVRYDSMGGLVDDLRAMGATNALIERSRRPLGRRHMLRAAEIYAERFSDPDGRVRATFNLLWMSGWAPHPSQPKPAPRGSATVSLAQALGSQKPPAST